MKLSELNDSFVIEDFLTIKVQVQVIKYLFLCVVHINFSINQFQFLSLCLVNITMHASILKYLREKIDRPFRCLVGEYRRKLVSAYLQNVEQICWHFIDERRSNLSKFIKDKLRWSRLDKRPNDTLVSYDPFIPLHFPFFWVSWSFTAFWLAMDPNVRHLTRENTNTILKVLVKHLFVEKEVRSTLVIDSLYSGLEALEYQSKNIKKIPKLTETYDRITPMVLIDRDMFVLANDLILVLERAALDTLPQQPLPTKDDKGSQNRTEVCNYDVSLIHYTLLYKLNITVDDSILWVVE